MLAYADYREQAARCLASLLPLFVQRSPCLELRVGLNEPSDKLEQLVLSITQPVENRTVIVQRPQRGKYPMMRRLFYDKPLTTSHVMWFDDDSFFTDNPITVVNAAMSSIQDFPVLGQKWRIPLRGGQSDWVRGQPWYTGRSITEKMQVAFPQGAWWIASSAFLQKYNWPIPELVHTGGDVMLGMLLYQQQLNWSVFSNGVAINADAAGRKSKAPRRGLSIGSQPIGTKR